MPTSRYFDRYPPFPEDVPVANVHVISYKELSQANENESKDLLCACNAHGFFLLDFANTTFGDHFLDCSERLMEFGKEIFSLGTEGLSPYAWNPPTSLFGYKNAGSGRIEDGSPDRYEFYNMSLDELRGISAPVEKPALVEANRARIAEYLRQCNEVVETVMTHLEKQLGLPKRSLLKAQDPTKLSGSSLRFLKYAPKTPTDQHTSLPGHTDIGSITILFNVVGGLQILTPDEEWLYVKPRPGCAIVNLGDAMVEWTGGMLRSNMHRVVWPPGKQAEYSKYSLAYVVRPNYKVSMSRMNEGNIPQLMESEDRNMLSARDWEVERTRNAQLGRNHARSRGGIAIPTC